MRIDGAIPWLLLINHIQPDLEVPKMATTSNTIHCHPPIPPPNIYNNVDCFIHTIASNIPFFFYEKPSSLSPAASQSQYHQFWWHFLKWNVIQNALPPSIQSRPLMAVERVGYYITIIQDPNYIFSPPKIPANCAQ